LGSVFGLDAVKRIADGGKLVFHAVGDTGQRSHGAEAQESVAYHMEQQLRPAKDDERPAFFYHLGDVVYYNGERDRYEGQFYEPYLHYTGPIFAIPGNHDGSTVPGGDSSLRGFVENFCASQPQHTWMAGHSNRTTMIQPNVYWTLKTPLATMIGIYSNVPGLLDRGHPLQEDWLTAELKAAKNEKCVIVSVHHPPYSLDDTHGGHKLIQDALDRAFHASGRIPTAIFAAHVHNYQRFERVFQHGHEHPVPYVVAGAGGFAGYTKLHQLKAGVHPPKGVKLVAHDTKLPGFLRVTITRSSLAAEYFTVPAPPHHLDPKHPAVRVDNFEIPLG